MKQNYLDKSVAWLSFLITMLSGCQNDNNASPADFVKGETMKFDSDVELKVNDSIEISDIFSWPVWQMTAKEICILDPFTSGNYAKLYDTGTCALVDSALIRGNGPGEFIAFNAGEGLGNDMIAYDIMNKRLCVLGFSLDKGIEVNEELTLFSDNEGRTYPYTFINRVDDSRYLMKSDEPEGTFWHIADLRDSKILGKTKNTTRPEGIGYSPYDFKQVLIGDSILGVAYSSIDRFEIYRIKENKIEPFRAYGSPDLNVVENSSSRQRYSISLASDGDNFYSLQSDDNELHGNRVQVYNGNSGDIKNILVLDRPVFSIRVYPDRRLVGLSQAEDCTRFYEWRLP